MSTERFRLRLLRGIVVDQHRLVAGTVILADATDAMRMIRQGVACAASDDDLERLARLLRVNGSGPWATPVTR